MPATARWVHFVPHADAAGSWVDIPTDRLLRYDATCMNVPFYFLSREACRCVAHVCIRQRVLYEHRAHRDGPLLLAVTHLSHLEPLFVTLHLRRHIRWMARVEFFRTWWGSLLLDRCGAFRVDRFGFSLPSVRRAIALLEDKQSVGVFPEGGVATGEQSVLRRGPIKHGVCTISIRTGVPILPVIVLGTHTLNCVKPWLPAKRGRVYIAYGQPLAPPPRSARRENRPQRLRLGEQLRDSFADLYQQMLQDLQLSDSDFP